MSSLNVDPRIVGSVDANIVAIVITVADVVIIAVGSAATGSRASTSAASRVGLDALRWQAGDKCILRDLSPRLLFLALFVLVAIYFLLGLLPAFATARKFIRASLAAHRLALFAT